MKIRVLICLILLPIFLVKIPTFVSAVDQRFSTYYDLLYQVDKDGKTTVTQRTTITNLSSAFLPKKIKLHIDYPIFNLAVYQLGNDAQFEASKSASGTDVAFGLVDPGAGIGAKSTYSLVYDTYDFVTKQGNVTNITIPNPKTSSDVFDFRIRLQTPTVFGKPQSIRPRPEQSGVWTKKDLGDQNINLILLPSDIESQYYNIDLAYQLKNSKNTSVYSEIPLPSDTDRQKVYLNSISPKPLSVTSDTRDNWWAKYYLGPNRSQEISVSGLIEIKKSTESATVSAAVKRDFDAVVAMPITGENNCQDIVEQFITLTSKDGIESRRVDGLVYPNSKKLHCWAQYYDSENNTWRDVDPVLEQTSLGWDYLTQWDLNHLIIKNGSESATNLVDYQVKPVVDFNPASFDPNISVRVDLPQNTFAGVPYVGKIIVYNLGPAALTPAILEISSLQLKSNKNLVSWNSLPPFSSEEIAVSFAPTDWAYNGNDIINLRVNKQNYPFLTSIHPIFASIIILLLGGVLFGAIIFSTSKITRGLSFPRRPR